MISYREIIAVVVFVTAILIIILLLFTKKVREREVEERKEKKLRDEEDIEKPSRWSFFKWFNDNILPLFFPIITPILVYTAILVSFSILLPDLWQKYWTRQEFFWISQVYLVVMVALGRLQGFWLKWMPRILFSLILFLYIQKEWPKPKTDGSNNSNIVATTAQQTEYGEWLVEVGPYKWSPDYCIPHGGKMEITPINPNLPFKYWLTLTNGKKKMVDVPPEREMGGKIFHLPDYKKIRIQSPEKTKILIVTKPL